MVKLLNLFEHSLVDYLMCFLSSHFIDKTVESYHCHQILFIVDPILLTIRFQFFVDESTSSSHPFLILPLDLHRVFAVGYPDFDRKFLHPAILLG